jgi:O-antigen ligase
MPATTDLATLVVVAVVGVGASWLALTRWVWFLAAVLAVRPIADWASVKGFDVAGVPPSTLMVAGFVAASLLWLVAQWADDALAPPSVSALAFGGLGVAALASTTVAPSIGFSASIAMRVVFGAVALVVVEQVLRRRPEDLGVLLAGVVASLGFPVLAALAQVADGTLWNGFRVAGSFAHPNAMGMYAVVVLALAVGVAPHVERRWQLVSYAAAAAATLLLGLSLARVAWVAAGIAVGVVGIVQARRMLAGAVLVAALAIAFVPAIGQRVDELRTEPAPNIGGDANSWEFRTRYWGEILPRWEEDRLLGVGLGTIEQTESARLEPHNIYVQTVVEMGVLGCAALSLVFVAVAWDLRAAWRRLPIGRSLGRGLFAAGAGIALGVAIGGVSDNLLTTAVVHLYAAVALAAAIVPGALDSVHLQAHPVGHRSAGRDDVAVPAVDRVGRA